MAWPEHVEVAMRGAKAIQEWRWRTAIESDPSTLYALDLEQADLTRANIRINTLGGGEYYEYANLIGADFRRARLSGATLRGVCLSRADFTGADLVGATLEGAHLQEANLREANLEGANLARADLTGVVFTKANLKRTILAQATCGGTVFADVDLTEAIGLEGIYHSGPSTLSIDVLYRSGARVPESFLRGCGVPEQFIIYARSLAHARSVAGQPIDFYSCFISYSTPDQAFAERLHAELVANNLRCWFAPEDFKIGDRFQERIEESIRLFDKLMIVLSKASVESRWVEREVNAALEREDREKRTVLFPIRIDNAVMSAPQPWAADIRRSRHIGDFSGWKDHDSYAKAIERLLRDLKAPEHS